MEKIAVAVKHYCGDTGLKSLAGDLAAYLCGNLALGALGLKTT